MTKYTIDVFEERDTLHIWITNIHTDKTVYHVSDNQIRELIDDGFFNPKYPEEFIAYLQKMKVI